MKSLFKLFTFLAVTIFGYVSADQDSTQQTHASVPMVTPSAGPRVENAIDAVFTVDFIYFDATQTGIPYAINNYADPSDPETQPTGNTYYPSFNFKPGFKIGFGLNLAHDAWDIMSQYTWFHTGKQTQFNTFSDETNLTRDDASYLPMTGAYSTWRLKLDVIDLDLGRNYYISQYLALRPFFGAKACWNRQQNDVQYSSDVIPLDEELVGLAFSYHNQHAFGIGLRTGVQTSWQFNRNWNIYGNSSFSLLNSHEKVTTRYTADIEGDVLTGANILNDQNTLQSVIELAMGFGYDYFFNDDNYHFAIQAGWDFQYWNNNNYFSKYASNLLPYTSRDGDLSLQGLDVKLRLDF